MNTLVSVEARKPTSARLPRAPQNGQSRWSSRRPETVCTLSLSASSTASGGTSSRMRVSERSTWKR